MSWHDPQAAGNPWGNGADSKRSSGAQRDKIAHKHRALEALWYKKLEDVGFRDIEVYGKDQNTYLRAHKFETELRVRRGAETGKDSRMLDIYQALDTETWPTRWERIRWADWAAGATIAELALRWPGAGSNDAFAARTKSRLKGMLGRANEDRDVRYAEEDLWVNGVLDGEIKPDVG